MRTLHRDHGIVAFQDVGGDGPALVMLAGLGLDSSSLGPAVESLRKHFRCVLIDNRGTGRSSAPEGAIRIEDMADDVVAVLDELRLDRAHVMGWSMGASITQAMLVYHRHRIDRAVLLSAIPRYSQVQRAWLSGTCHLREREGQVNAALFGLPWFFTPRALAQQDHAWRLATVMAANPAAASDDVYERQGASLREFNVLDQLGGIENDVLVLVGAEDVLTPPEQAVELAAAIPCSVLEVLPRGGHGALIEYTDDVTRAVRRFLQRAA